MPLWQEFWELWVFSNLKWKKNPRKKNPHKNKKPTTTFLPNKNYKFLTILQSLRMGRLVDGERLAEQKFSSGRAGNSKGCITYHVLHAVSFKTCPGTCDCLEFFFHFVVCFKMHYLPHSVLSNQHMHVHQLFLAQQLSNTFLFITGKKVVLFSKCFTSILRSVF